MKQLSTLTEFAAVHYISETHKHNTTDTYTDDWWMNAAVVSCRPNLNNRWHVCVLCMHKAQISVQRSDNLNVMLKCFSSDSPSKFHASTLHIISIPNHCISSHSIPLNLTDRSSYPNTSRQRWCLEACWTQTLSLKFGMNYKTVLTDNLNRYCTIFHTLYKLDTKRCGKPHFHSPLFLASAASTT